MHKHSRKVDRSLTAKLKELIKDASSWDEVFERIEKSGSTNQEKGRLFEDFFHCAYSYESKDIKEIWPFEGIPESIKGKLNFAGTDHGVDFLIQNKAGQYIAVQCKYTGNPERRLNWSRDRLTNFFTEAEGCHGLLLFSNAAGIDAHSRNKKSEKLTFAGPNELKLSREDFKNISVEKRSTRKILSPFDYQSQAIDKVIEAFGKEDRGQLILPCGAGKTLVSFWVYERLSPAKCLVLMPSLALLRQFKESWEEAQKEFRDYLCVCSEKDIAQSEKEDSVTSQVYELPAPGRVTTDPKAIKKFLMKDEKQIVYATYQSSDRIQEAMRGSGLQFDLAVCDEAHKTATGKDSHFNIIHHNTKIACRKRLYMTATPRVIGADLKNKIRDEARFKTLADMNDTSVFGRVFHRMGFAEGIQKGFLSDYRITAMGISDKEVHQAIKEGVFLESSDDPADTHDLAKLYALKKAITNRKMTHVVSFHSSIKRAQNFYKEYRPLDEMDCFHVNGKQSTKKRGHLIRDFTSSKKALLTNSRCLTEGVDVPEIDGIYFCDPRHSLVDIVQASGRALRLPKDRKTKKKLGHIVVPIFHKDRAELEGAIDASSFKTVVDIVRALANQDERLEEEIRNLRTERRKATGAISGSPHLSVNIAGGIDIDGSRLQEALFSQIIEKTRLPWRRFEEARGFVRALGLKSATEWRQYCQGEIKGMEAKPEDIPAAPWHTYKDQGWQGLGDWLGTGTIAPRNREYRPFEEARQFVHALELKSSTEWSQYCKGKLDGREPKPEDIPMNPHRNYKAQGWQGWGDWLGTGTMATQNREYRSFEEARQLVHRLDLRSQKEWKEYCKGKLEGRVPRPEDIPAKPDHVYKDQGWQGMGDWLGTGTIANFNKEYRPFSEARKFVRALELKSGTEWRKYCKGEIEEISLKPEDIPANPNQTYKAQGWEGMGDWLGTGRVADQYREYRPFEEAREFVHALKLKSRTEWNRYCKGELKGMEPKPEDIPANPNKTYKDQGWQGMGDWLGTGTIASYNKKYRPFQESRQFVHALKLKSSIEWRKYCQEELPGINPKPEDIPAKPYRTYKNQGWQGMGDWLGTGTIASRNREYRPFEEARGFVRGLGLKNHKEWKRYCKGEMEGMAPKPEDIPAAPSSTYKNQGWQSWGDWLGTGTIANFNREFRPFEEARQFVHALKLKSETQWRQYCKGELEGIAAKPEDIPAVPKQTYKSQGWQSIGDWLGTGTIANFNKRYRPFDEARRFVHALKLKSGTEWRQYCKGGLKGMEPKPEDIPAGPNRTYKDQGWQGMGDWLGTGTIASYNREYRPFDEARKFVHALKLKSGTEWRQYCKGELEGINPKPEDIPTNPHRNYKDQGWKGWGDWLGTGTIAPFNREYRPFEEARQFVHSLELKNQKEWGQYCKGELEGIAAKPKDIPASPNQTYKDQGWKGMGDWLGTGRVADQYKKYRLFQEAQEFVHTLKLKSGTEWKKYCKGELEGVKPKPEDIPAKPDHVYKAQGWQGMGDWLGTGIIATRNREYRPFEEARQFVHAIELKNGTEWGQYCKEELEGIAAKPEDIPADPRRVYKSQGWQSMGDWLGTGTIANQDREYRPFDEARKFVHGIKLKNNMEWRRYCKGEFKSRRPKPEDIPVDPRQVYKNQGWQSFGDWLGTGTIANFNKKFRPFEEARQFVHSLELKNQKEWGQYCKGELSGINPKPEDIPAKPQRTYKAQGWQGFGDWLGTTTIAPQNKKYRPFQEARQFVHALELKSSTEWYKYCQGELAGRKSKPEDIPANPQQTYKNKGWQGMGDWLRNGHHGNL